MARAPMPSAPVPSAPMFEETRADRHETTDSHRVVGKKPWLLIGGGIGAVALLLVIVMLMRSKDEPKVADKPSKPTPDLVDPVVTPPPDEVVAVVTPDAAEPPPDAGVPPRIGKNPIVATSPENRTPKNPGTPKNPKNPRIRGTTTSAIETGSTPDPVTGGGGDPEKSAKAQAAYKTGNQKLYAGDANGAIIAYRQVIAMGSASGYRGLGLSYAQQGDTANAIAAFKKYLQMSPKAADAAVIKRRLTALQGK